MSLLFRYILKFHTRLLLMTLFVSISIFVLMDLIDKVDIFAAADGWLKLLLLYYVTKMPSIISQILPAVFLFASIILLCSMVASRESIALHAGGISLFTTSKILIICGVFWAIVQFFFSQFLSVVGEQYSEDLWQYEIRERTQREEVLHNLWLIDEQYLVQMDSVSESGKGSGITIYEFDTDAKNILAMIRAKSFQASEGNWLLSDVEIADITGFNYSKESKLDVPISQSVQFFFVSEEKSPQQLSFFLLGDAIERLTKAGSNVESLRTLWHGKLAYAFSIAVMAVVAMAIVSYQPNIYIAMTLSIIAVFLLYILIMFGESLGQQGIVPAFAAAWAPNLLLLLVAFMRLQYVSLRR